MDSTIVAAIISVFAALLGAVIGGVLTYRATKSIERRKILSEKYEVIYDSSVQIRDWLKNENTRWLLIVEPSADVFSAVDDLPCPIEKLIMMTDLYAPSLEKVVSEIEVRVNAVHSLKWEYSLGEIPYEITQDTFRQSNIWEDTLHNDLVKAIKGLTKTNLLW